ncbi:ABC transporter permease [Fibrella sp. WM1]|uniref:ABC transporter permease n=1 Tax=Fibrella musci TaxID=3242485 RepID=UPI003522704C
MFQHYLTIALRNLRKNRTFAIINAVGLGLGIAAFGIIWEYVAFERSVDQFHTNLPRLYRVLLQEKSGPTSEFSPGGFTVDAQAALPDIERTCRVVTGAASGIVSVQQPRAGAPSVFRESNAAMVDGSFFQLFSFPVLRGNPASLGQPNVVFLSERKARTYFGNASAQGQTITLSSQFGKLLFTVGGVYADMPDNSDIRYDLLYSLQTLANPANRNGNDWADPAAYNANFLQAVLLLKPDANPDALEKKLTDFYHSKKPDDRAVTVRLQSSAYVHLGRSLNDPLTTIGSLGFVYLLSALALLIMLIAWLNYVNLSTTTALTRAKEVGVRKVVGATQGQLAAQLLAESLLINVLGMGLGLLLLSLVQPLFNQFIGKQLSLGTLLLGRQGEVGLWFWGLLALLSGALVSGGYVAFALTRLRPVEMMRGSGHTPGRSAWLRQSLVVVQFGIAVALIVVTLVMVQQVRFLQQRPLGLTLDRLLAIRGPEVGKDQPDFRTRRTAYQQQVAQLAFVEAWSNTGSVPGNFYNFNSSGITRQNPRPDDDKKTYNVIFADDRFLPTFGIKLLAGQNFTPTHLTADYEKGSPTLINEKAALDMGFSSAKAAAGQVLVWGGNTYEIVGVVSNYRHQSPKTPIAPLIMFPRVYSNYLTVRLAAGNVPEQLSQLERLYKASFPGNPFDYFFVPERYNEQYQTEQQYTQLFSIAAGLAIFIACLGLFGLAAFTAQRRTKEIGVRKVLGASEAGIVALLSKDFIQLVGVAFLIATPVAWWIMDRWLQDFAEKTPLHWWLFAGAGSLAALIALLTVSYQTLRAARANPVVSLRAD